VLLKLLDKHFLVLLVDVADKFELLSGLICLDNLSGKDLICVSKPDRAMIILNEFTTHLKNFNVVNFLNVVAHFETLFLAVAEIILILYHGNVVGAWTVIILEWLASLGLRSVELNDYRDANSCLGLYTSLYVSEFLPKLALSLAIVLLWEVIISQNLQIIDLFLFYFLLARVII